MMEVKLNFMHIMPILKHGMKLLRAGMSVTFCLEQKKSIEDGHSMAIQQTEVTKGFGSLFGLCFHVPRGDDRQIVLEVKTSRTKTMKIYPIPSTFVIARHNGNVTLFYCSRAKKLIASWYHNYGLDPRLAKDLSYRFQLAFNGKNTLRRSPKRMGVGGMIGGGGYKARFKPRKNWVEFFTHAEKLQTIIANSNGALDCQSFIDKYSHIELVEILMSLHMTYNSKICATFLDGNAPFFMPQQH